MGHWKGRLLDKEAMKKETKKETNTGLKGEQLIESGAYWKEGARQIRFI